MKAHYDVKLAEDKVKSDAKFADERAYYDVKIAYEKSRSDAKFAEEKTRIDAKLVEEKNERKRLEKVLTDQMSRT